jgi:hypothetical protein
MPRISQFFGIIVAMYYGDHNPPHFHVRYGEHEALVAIDSLELVEGWLPRRALAMVIEWAMQQRSALRQNWDKALRGLPLDSIAPLE